MTSHRLIEPTFHLEEKICKKHERLLDAYCRTDHTCICTACADAMHKSHDIVSIDHEFKKKTVSSSSYIYGTETIPPFTKPLQWTWEAFFMSLYNMKIWRIQINLFCLWVTRGYDRTLKVIVLYGWDVTTKDLCHQLVWVFVRVINESSHLDGTWLIYLGFY